MLKDKISVFIDGKLEKVCDQMIDALAFIEKNGVGHKVIIKCEKENSEC